MPVVDTLANASYLTRNVSIVSTGIRMSFFPVAAAPAVPTPAPAPAPMAAPLPPPANAPIIAPAAAVPPIAPASRPLCEPPLRLTVLVVTCAPLIDSNCSDSNAVPDNRLDAFASTTRPCTGSPRRATTRPSTTTSLLSVPAQLSPDRALSDEIVCPRRTLTEVPDGIDSAACNQRRHGR
jgi:hypothetical protein